MLIICKSVLATTFSLPMKIKCVYLVIWNMENSEKWFNSAPLYKVRMYETEYTRFWRN